MNLLNCFGPEDEEEQTYEITIRATKTKYEALKRYMSEFDIAYF